MEKDEILTGTLDLLILRVLGTGPLHGFAIGERIQVLSHELLKVEEGSLYPALHRMEAKGWMRAEWGHSEQGRRRKTYHLTASGRKRAEHEGLAWAQMTTAIAHVLRNTA